MGLVRKAGADDIVPGEGGSNMSTIIRDAVAAEIERQRLERVELQRQRDERQRLERQCLERQCLEHGERQESDPA